MELQLILGAIVLQTATVMACMRMTFNSLATRIDDIARRFEAHETSCESYREETLARVSTLQERARGC